jgi:hypothetical protein
MENAVQESRTKRLGIASQTLDERLARHSRSYLCRCGNRIFFRNTLCLACHSQLGYLTDDGRMVALDPGSAPDTWHADSRVEVLKLCANRRSPAWCNWTMDAHDTNRFCIACRLNRTIPDLDDADNARYWSKIEIAKRRMVSDLLDFGLPVRSRVSEDLERGLMFDFLRSPPQGPRVLTGHANGLITLNVEEADDAKREQIKYQLHEPYRTLLGHFRHEVGHYYWDRLVCDSRWLEPFRQLFGDERASYAEALKRNYEQGPPADWASRHVSAYASTHPWEDWAETWAHYMHVVDSLSTALGFGIDVGHLRCEAQPFSRNDLYAPDAVEAGRFIALLNAWIEMVTVLNELARSMGQPDFYPFVMCRAVVAKLHFIHLVIVDARTQPDH